MVSKAATAARQVKAAKVIKHEETELAAPGVVGAEPGIDRRPGRTEQDAGRPVPEIDGGAASDTEETGSEFEQTGYRPVSGAESTADDWADDEQTENSEPTFTRTRRRRTT